MKQKIYILLGARGHQVVDFGNLQFTGAERHLRRMAKVNAIRANPTVVYSITAVPFAKEASVQFQRNVEAKE